MDPSDGRRLDALVPVSSVAHGLPLFVDATCASPSGQNGAARPGTTTRDSATLADTGRKNLGTFHEAHETGLGYLYCLGTEIFGKLVKDPLDLVPKIVRTRCRRLPQSVRVGLQAALPRRRWGLLGVAVQREMVQAILCRTGGDLVDHALEHSPSLSDFPASSPPLSLTHL